MRWSNMFGIDSLSRRRTSVLRLMFLMAVGVAILSTSGRLMASNQVASSSSFLPSSGSACNVEGRLVFQDPTRRIASLDTYRAEGGTINAAGLASTRDLPNISYAAVYGTGWHVSDCRGAGRAIEQQIGFNNHDGSNLYAMSWQPGNFLPPPGPYGRIRGVTRTVKPERLHTEGELWRHVSRSLMSSVTLTMYREGMDG